LRKRIACNVERDAKLERVVHLIKAHEQSTADRVHASLNPVTAASTFDFKVLASKT
jgi:hypothetical protein